MLFCAFLCSCRTSDVLAQSKPGPKEFYEQDFASQPAIKKGSSVQTPEKRDPLLAIPLVPGSEPEDFSDPKSAKKGFFENKESKEMDLGEVARGKTIPVISVGLIVNSLDKQHLKAVMAELIAVAREHDFAIDQVYTIGNMLNLQEVQDLVLKVTGRGGELSVKSQPPEKYDVYMSPTWIIKTEKGEIIHEATGPLGSHFTSSGEYIDNDGRFKPLTKATPEPGSNAESEPDNPQPSTPLPSDGP